MPLVRFVEAQDANGTYLRALHELREGHKRTHWMWFVFPQIAGLGRSPTAQFYALASRAEAQAYLAHLVLGPRLAECTDAVLAWSGVRSAKTIFGDVDAAKFRSSMTLFEAAGETSDRFGKALEAFYQGQRDEATLRRF